MAGSAVRPRIYGECGQCQRRFNYLAPAGKTSWSGKCTGCGMPVTATLAGAKPTPEPDPSTKTKAIPKATYRTKTKDTDDAPTGTQDPAKPADGGAGGAPPIPVPGVTDPAAAGGGEPPADGPPAGGKPPKQDEPLEGKDRGGDGERKPVRERHGNYGHLGYPY